MRFDPGSIALTVLGWTPGLRRLVTGRALSCGCLVGVYERRTGGCVEILDGRSETCALGHTVNLVLGVTALEPATERPRPWPRGHGALQTRPLPPQ
jgi:hypothetical protein